MGETTYYQRNRETMLKRAKDYYQNKKELLIERANNKYRDKNIKREYGRNRYHNVSEKKKKLKQYQKKLS